MFRPAFFGWEIKNSQLDLFLKMVNYHERFDGRFDSISCSMNSPDPKLMCEKASTPWKINIEPGNDGLEDHFPFPGVYSQVPC